MSAERTVIVAMAVCLTLWTSIAAVPPVSGAAEIDIPYTKFVLDNGLRLIVHEDPKAPIVAVNVWYHVGSKNEKPGKTGFAHLFEHLMFNGSENYNNDYFKPFDRIGATDMNGTTNFDRTNYFQNVPTAALDVALWMESDRMGHLLGAIDQARLDEQRGVVQNEKRQGENRPYGKAFRLIVENTYPDGHPYSWSVIGSMEDLDAATLDDVHDWFETYYGAANAVISIAGDVNAEEIKQKVERFFGDIPSGPPVVRQQAWVAKRDSDHRLVLEDRVPQARIYKVWNVPEWKAPDTDYLGLVSDVLTSGKTSRLHKRLVYDEQVATNVRGYTYERELGSLFVVSATAQPGQDLAEVERLLDEEMARFIADGPTPEELARVKTQHRASFIRGIERIGGFGGKSDILARSEVYGGDPGFYKVQLKRQADATLDDLRGAARRWLSSGALVLEVKPFPEYTTVASGVDRSELPEPGPWPEVRFPELERAELSNGLDTPPISSPSLEPAASRWTCWTRGRRSSRRSRSAIGSPNSARG
jgi:zinc protease